MLGMGAIYKQKNNPALLSEFNVCQDVSLQEAKSLSPFSVKVSGIKGAPQEIEVGDLIIIKKPKKKLQLELQLKI